ncbi:MAG: AAA family ATPase [Phycisphaeraceae bacterium]
MRTIAIINQKGGTGKTTTAINLAAVMANKGRKTLLVDMDPQSHCSLGLAVPEDQLDRTVADLLRAGLDGSLAFTDIIWQITRHLDLAPSSMALAGIEQELANAPDKDRRLAQVLSTVSDQYEFCIIDCPPSIGLLTFNALRAAGEVIIPVETGYFALRGAIKQQQTIEMLARRVAHQARFNVLATMYDVRTKLAREILTELRKHFGERLLPVVVHFNARLKEAASFGQAITEYDPASTGYEDFDRLSEWLISHPPSYNETITGELADPGQPTVPVTANVSNPALSRAAELVERARALSARTAALSGRISHNHPDSEPDEPGQGRHPGAAASRPLANTAPALAPAPSMPSIFSLPPLVPPRDRLAEKLSRLYGVRQTSQGLLFVQPVGEAHTMAIAGEFNDWSAETHPMRLDERLGIWQTCLKINPGRYRYRLVVDGNWVHDPHNQTVETNPFGELNSIVEVGAHTEAISA